MTNRRKQTSVKVNCSNRKEVNDNTIQAIDLPDLTADQKNYLEHLKEQGETYDPNVVIGGPSSNRA